MPNWCGNYATIKHKDPKRLTELKQAMSDGEWFNTVLPTPKELEDVESPSRDSAERQQELIAKYGANDWYNWRVQNWGTKWDTDVEDPDISDDGLTLDTGYFETAWAPATAIYAAMEEQGYTVTAYYYEPGMGFCGRWEDSHDDYYEIGSTADATEAQVPEDINETFGISAGQREWEEEEASQEEVTAWYREGVEKLGLDPVK
jgi:hypothetical protein